MRFGGRKLRRAAFWYLDSEALAVAVIAKGRHEPELETCAGLRRPTVPMPLFAPGILELARATGACSLPSVAALGTNHSHIVAIAQISHVGDQSHFAGSELRGNEHSEYSEQTTTDVPKKSAPIITRISEKEMIGSSQRLSMISRVEKQAE